MSDYNFYSFDVKLSDVLHTLKEAHDFGCSTMLLINGLYYTVNFEEDSKTKLDCPSDDD